MKKEENKETRFTSKYSSLTNIMRKQLILIVQKEVNIEEIKAPLFTFEDRTIMMNHGDISNDPEVARLTNIVNAIDGRLDLINNIAESIKYDPIPKDEKKGKGKEGGKEDE